MLILKNVFKGVIFLFLFLSTPSINASIEVIENALLNHSVLKEEKLVNNSERGYCKKHQKLSYYLYVADFISSFIEIPTSNVLVDSSTLSSKYLAGRAPLYNTHNEKAGNCSASFLCMQNTDGIYTDISNYLSVDNGLVISWFTPTTLINLELDSIVHSMVTECIVIASTKVGFNPFYGKKFNMIVSSDGEKVYFKLTEI